MGVLIKDLKVFNKALLGKWIYRFGMKDNAFWRGLVAEKYGTVDAGRRTRNIVTPFGCGLWGSIMNGLEIFVDISLLRLGT